MVVIDDVVTVTVHGTVDVPAGPGRTIGLGERLLVAARRVGRRLRVGGHRPDGPEGQAQAKQPGERSARARSRASHRARPLGGSVLRNAKGVTLPYPPGEDSILS